MPSLAGLVRQRLLERLHLPLQRLNPLLERTLAALPSFIQLLAKGEGKRSQMGPPGRIDESQGPNEEPQIALCTHNASVMERRKPMRIKIIRSTTEYLATSAVA